MQRGAERPEKFFLDHLLSQEEMADSVREFRRELQGKPEAERRALWQVAPLVLQVLAGGSAREIRELEQGLRESGTEDDIPEDPEEMSDELLRKLELENLLRLWARYREIESRSLPGRELRAKLGDISRQRLEQLRNQKKLLGLRLPFRQTYYYPSWQFDPETGETLPELDRLLSASREAGMGPVALDGFMTSRSAGEGDSVPYEVYRSNSEGRERVLSYVGAALDVGS